MAHLLVGDWFDGERVIQLAAGWGTATAETRGHVLGDTNLNVINNLEQSAGRRGDRKRM